MEREDTRIEDAIRLVIDNVPGLSDEIYNAALACESELKVPGVIRDVFTGDEVAMAALAEAVAGCARWHEMDGPDPDDE